MYLDRIEVHKQIGKMVIHSYNDSDNILDNCWYKNHINSNNVNCITTGDTFTNTYTYPRGTPRVPPLVVSL